MRAFEAARRRRWEEATAVPLVVLGIGFIIAYSVVVLAGWLPGWGKFTIGLLLALTWVVFIVDIVVRVVLTPRGARAQFIFRHPIDVLSAGIPVFRVFRVLGVLREVPYFRRTSGNAVRAKIIIYAATYAVAFVYFIALATLVAERHVPGATITNFGDAIWWACVTLATVGYGDVYPITTVGRTYAVLLMVGGVAIVGTASATAISVINERMASAARHEHSVRHNDAADAANRADADE